MIDGTPATVGAISQAGPAGSAFLVRGSHTYADESPAAGYAVSVTLADPSGSSATALTTATVAEADVLIGVPATINLTEGGSPYTGVVASFSDPGYANNAAADFSALLAFGLLSVLPAFLPALDPVVIPLTPFTCKLEPV